MKRVYIRLAASERHDPAYAAAGHQFWREGWRLLSLPPKRIRRPYRVLLPTGDAPSARYALALGWAVLRRTGRAVPPKQKAAPHRVSFRAPAELCWGDHTRRVNTALCVEPPIPWVDVPGPYDRTVTVWLSPGARLTLDALAPCLGGRSGWLRAALAYRVE